MQRAPRPLVVAITGDPTDAIVARRGTFGQILAEAAGVVHDEARVVDLRVQDLDLPDGAALVISGSAANVHHREPWMLRAEAQLRALVERDVPILGVCFGHQLLAQALGGEVQPNPRGREMSTVVIERVGDDPILRGLGRRFTANACHSDTVARRPPGAEVIAKNDIDAHQGLRFGPRQWGVQFHPEFDTFIMQHYVDTRREPMIAEGLDPDEAFARAGETDAACVIANFLAALDEG